jgi:hypothetical protein
LNYTVHFSDLQRQVSAYFDLTHEPAWRCGESWFECPQWHP